MPNEYDNRHLLLGEVDMEGYNKDVETIRQREYPMLKGKFAIIVSKFV